MLLNRLCLKLQESSTFSGSRVKISKTSTVTSSNTRIINGLSSHGGWVSFGIETLVRGIHKYELERGECHVALALAFPADDAGYCFPSLLLIAQDAHVTERAAVLCSPQPFTDVWSKDKRSRRIQGDNPMFSVESAE